MGPGGEVGLLQQQDTAAQKTNRQIDNKISSEKSQQHRKENEQRDTLFRFQFLVT